MDSGRTNVSITNNIVYVEPNYTKSTNAYDKGGLETFEFIPDLEDYSIFVNLEVETIGRTIHTGNKVYRFSYISKGDGESVNLMGGSKIPTGDGKFINSLTTNWTDTHINDLKNYGSSPELFGIKYIDIAYNNFMVPEVTIEFVDVRGAAVFGQKELFETNNTDKALGNSFYDDNIVNTFFQCFFTFPYPKFTLIVKGFYGNPVSYELTCSDFRAKFDSNTGSFSCTAKFVGYLFSFLGDVMINALVAAPYSDFIGADYWKSKEFKFKAYNGGEILLPTIAELIKKMKNAETASQQISQSSPEVQEKNNIEQITERYKKVKVLYTTYVNSIRDAVEEKTVSVNNETIDLFISDIENNTISEAAIILVGNSVTKKFSENFKDDGSVQNAYINLMSEIESFKGEYPDIEFPSLNDFSNAIPKQRIFQNAVNTSKYDIDLNNVNDDIKNRSQTLYDTFGNKVRNQNKDNEVNRYSNFTVGYFYDDGGFTNSLNEAMSKLSEREVELNRKIESNAAEALAQRLGFSPSVENMTKIMMAHFETFAYMIFKTARLIDNETPIRDTNKIGITNEDDISDVPNSFKQSENGYTVIPPFPKVTKIVDKQGVRNREESWVGDYGNMFRETDLVNGILNGIKEFVDIAESSGNTTGEAGSTTTSNSIMEHPLSPLDFTLTKNIYDSFDQNEVSSLLGLVCLRALQILGTTNFRGWNDDCETLGEAEAENLLKSEKLSSGLKQKLSAISASEVVNMLEGNESGAIPKPSSGIWPWQKSPQSVGIIANNQLNICKNTESNGSVIYTLPLQSLNWNTIKSDVLDSCDAIFSDDYFNIDQSATPSKFKNNVFYLDTNIGRIKNIAEKQLTSPEDISGYKEKIINEASYDSNRYNKYLSDKSNILIAYPIENAGKMVPESFSCMLPCTKSFLKVMNWGGGYEMEHFHEEDLGGNWKDKDGNIVKRKGPDGYDDFLKELDTNSFTLTEVPGLDENLLPLEHSTFSVGNEPYTSLFTQKLYYYQTNDKVKGFMLLCSLGYLYDYKEILSEELCKKDKTISIIPLPAVIFAGGLLWSRQNENEFKGCSLGKLYGMYNGLLDTLDKQIQLKLIASFENWIEKGVENNNIIVSFNQIRSSMEIQLIKEGRTYDNFFDALDEFEDSNIFSIKRDWFKEGIFADSKYNGVLDFLAGELGDSFFRNYICIDEDLGGKKGNGTIGGTIGMRVGNRDGSPAVKQLVDFALAPCLFMKNSKFFFKDTPKVLSVENGDLQSFFEGFLNRIKEEDNSQETDESVSQAKDPETTTDIKVGVYRYCKLLYDKWIGGLGDEDFEKRFTMFEFFDSDTKYFHFIDAYYNYANELTINISKFCDMIKSSYASADYSLLSFLSNVYSQNKFNLLCVQNFLDISKKENMQRMFDLVPYTEIDLNKIQNHPNFIVNYAYEASSHLDMDNDEYSNDGFMLNVIDNARNKWPEALKSRNQGATEGLNVPAFGVSYGKMYQSYFKDVNISMENPTVTEQSIKAQFAIACQHNEQSSQSDDSKEYTYGQDLYSVYSNNSYECEVVMMGCAWVQPLMLFVLNNVPMFRGTYQIINVSHYIEQGEMTTRFKGVRMANVTTRIVEENCVKAKKRQTGSGENTDLNRQAAYADIDNDCEYAEYPLSVEGSAGGGIPESFLNMNYHQFCGGNINKYNQGNGYGTTWLTDSKRTIGEVLCAAIGAEYRSFTQNNYLMLKLGAAIVCNKYNWCKTNNKWVYLFGTYQQGTGNRAANQETYDSIKDIVLPIFKNGPGSLVGEVAKVQNGRNVEIWNRGKTEHKKAPNTHVITLDDMQRIFAYSTCIGYDYEHLNKYKGNQTAFENKSIPNNGNSAWKKADFLLQEFNTVYTSMPTKPGEKFWEPAPPVVNNGEGKVSSLSNGFLHALNQTSQSSSARVEIGVDREKSSGDTIYLTNANNSTDFGKVLDMMLQAYGSKIEKIKWIVPGNGENQNLPPEGYLVYLKEGSNIVTVEVVNSSNNELVQSISISNEGGIDANFKKALCKRYVGSSASIVKKRAAVALIQKYVLPTMSEEDINTMINANEIKSCDTIVGPSESDNGSGGIDAPASTTEWNVDAFVQNLHHYQDTICENKEGSGKARKSVQTWTLPNKFGRTKNGCGWCTSVVNRALRDVGFGMKYWGGEPWEVYNKMTSSDSDFVEIESNSVANTDRSFPRTNALAGDICVMWNKVLKSKDGRRHTCAFDGSHWISDFVQKQANVYGSSDAFTLEYHVFRHK